MKTFSVLSWNVQGKLNLTGYTSFKKIEPYLRNATHDILALQEMPDARVKLKPTGILRSYNAYIPRFNSLRYNRERGFNQNILLSKHPFIRVSELTFPSWENHPLENCIRADVQIAKIAVRIYVCHFQIFKTGVSTRLRQLERIFADAKRHTGPIIICGDLNTTIPKPGWRRTLTDIWHQEPIDELIINGKLLTSEERSLFKKDILEHGYTEVLGPRTPTWSPFKTPAWQLFKRKLDWFIIKDLKPLDYKLGEYVSDHRAVHVTLRLK